MTHLWVARWCMLSGSVISATHSNTRWSMLATFRNGFQYFQTLHIMTCIQHHFQAVTASRVFFLWLLSVCKYEGCVYLLSTWHHCTWWDLAGLFPLDLHTVKYWWQQRPGKKANTHCQRQWKYILLRLRDIGLFPPAVKAWDTRYISCFAYSCFAYSCFACFEPKSAVSPTLKKKQL